MYKRDVFSPTFLQTVSEEKEKTAAELQERERLAKQLEEEKENLEKTTTDLKGDLMVSRDYVNFVNFLRCVFPPYPDNLVNVSVQCR